MATYDTPGGTIVTNPPTNNSPSASPELQQFLASTFADTNGTAPVSTITPTGSSTTPITFSDPIGVVSPGSDVSLTVTANTFLFASGGSKLDLSSSPRFAADGTRLHVDVTLGSGDNTVQMSKGPNVATSTTGNDTLTSGGGHDSLYGGSGQDSLVGGGHSFLAGGSAGGDTLVGGTSASSHDTLYAGIGGDVLSAKQGQNVVYGASNDTVMAGKSQDTVVAGSGPETIHGGLGATIYGGGNTFSNNGNNNTYNATGADTIYGSNHSNTVNVQDGSNGVTVDGRTGTGALSVNINTTDKGNDTLFGGTGTDSQSNLTVHVSQTFSVSDTLDNNGLHVVQLAGGQTLHVTNVVIDFNGQKTNV